MAGRQNHTASLFHLNHIETINLEIGDENLAQDASGVRTQPLSLLTLSDASKNGVNYVSSHECILGKVNTFCAMVKAFFVSPSSGHLMQTQRHRGQSPVNISIANSLSTHGSVRVSEKKIVLLYLLQENPYVNILSTNSDSVLCEDWWSYRRQLLPHDLHYLPRIQYYSILQDITTYQSQKFSVFVCFIYIYNY